MKPRGPLMVEHRLIEKVLLLVQRELDQINERKSIDQYFIHSVIDFIRTYADRTHHGKEEGILFAQLADKDMSAADHAMMEDLVAEHNTARKAVADLVQANGCFEKGDDAQIEMIKEKLAFLTAFYPVHIEKEDHAFFPNTERYFTAEELDEMLAEFWLFDRSMIHEKYNRLYETLKVKF